jgi:hypothetical protein
MAAMSGHGDEPLVELTFTLPSDEHDALVRLAAELSLSPAATLRKALGTELFLRGLLEEGAIILYRKPDGAGGEIAF